MQKYHTAQSILNKQLVQQQIYKEKMLYSDPIDFQQDQEKIKMAEESKIMNE